MNMILRWDLNLTLSEKENRGSLPRYDGLGYFFVVLFESKELVELQPLKLTPTRRNNRSGEQAISKRLDRFFLSGYLIVKTWVKVGSMSNHLPFLLQIQSPEMKPATQFKFNLAWLLEEDYRKLIGDTWSPLVVNPNITFMK